MNEVSRGALVRGAILCIERALDCMKAAGNLLKMAGMREEECGILMANAYLHASRTLPQLTELSKTFPRVEATGKQAV